MSTEAGKIGLGSLPKRQVYITFAGVMLAMFLSSLDQTVVGTAMPRIISDLGGFSHYTWVTTAYIVLSAAAIPITGKLTDMYGRKSFYIIGLSIFIAASCLCGLSQTMTQIIIFRGLQGLGGGIMMAIAFTVTGDLFPPRERGKYQGFISAVFGLSSIIGPMLGGFITDALSWHWIFFVNIPLGITTIILFVFYFPDFRLDKKKHRVDYAGAITLVIAVVSVMLALSWGGVEYDWGSALIIGMFSLAAVMVAAFIIIENRSPEPIIPLWLFRNRIVAVSVVMTFFTGMSMFVGVTFIPLFFQGVLGATATTSGSFLTPMMLGQVAGSFTSGQVLSRAGGHYRWQGAIGLTVMAIGMTLLSQMTTETSYGQAVANIVITGFGMGITMPLYTIAIQNTVPYNVLGVASSASAFFRSVGGSVGLAIFGSIMSNRFASELINNLPAAIKGVIPPEQLAALTQNPQALVSPEAQAQLKSLLVQFGPQGIDLFPQLLQTLRQALNSAVSHVFFIGIFVAATAFIINLFIREIPLRRQHVMAEQPASKNKEE